ncbi:MULTISPECIES: glycosyltransferase family 4 protein [Cohnella]|jgi:glycosyltransferase involved in cell wall biosynthesis|uniref:glycosyltransferase family 4 protein n=1 Tax=Cohnella TaxID=329857 RepID=UPI00037E7202|nr:MULTISPECIES: glycosyltransferase family 4 protein [Cohnella]REK61199.1 MAG: glycosyl transferase family 1 [Cohnella sp.]
MNKQALQIGYVSTYVPKKCGLATYTHHLREEVAAAKNSPSPDPVIAVCDPDEASVYDKDFHFPLLKHVKDDYARMADVVNRSSINIVSLQHEFGIFGGEAGHYVLEFLERLKKPVVTTFHTVFEQPVEPYASVQAQIAARSEHIHVMNRRAIGYLHDRFDIPLDKISFIPHGSPVPNFKERKITRRQYGWENRKVLFQFGLLSRSKGVESLLKAVALAVKAVPDLLYIIAGQTHPEVRKHEGEAYREELAKLIDELDLRYHVRMINRYLPEEELTALISACDLYVTPYPGMQQITSGTLAYAAGLGRPILSTPYSYAKDLVQGYEELLLPYGDTEAWSGKIIELFTYPELLANCEKWMVEIGRSMQWPQVGAQYLGLLEKVAAKKSWSMADVG